MNTCSALVDKLDKTHCLTKAEYAALIRARTPSLADDVFEKARTRQRQYYGRDIYVRGLIEFTNYCRNDCYYCGIRHSRQTVSRYRLTDEQILSCCAEGYELGFRTFVLQGGEDPFFTPQHIARLVSRIKRQYPDCAVTLSVGEHSRTVYQLWFDAGADRYLLRHETADAAHYRRLHPASLSLENRKRCLWDLKEIGYQVGCGFMVGTPYQTEECLAEDLVFIQQLQPQMVGIGPFIPASGTPFADQPAGSLDLTLYLLGLIRLLVPDVLLPATTALGTIHPQGREQGILAGANVCMPNLSPADVREKYALYDNKICTGEEGAQCRGCLSARMEAIGYRTVVARGDHPGALRKAASP